MADEQYRAVFLTALDRAHRISGCYAEFREAMIVPIQTIPNRSLCGDTELLSAVEAVMIPGTGDIGQAVSLARGVLSPA